MALPSTLHHQTTAAASTATGTTTTTTTTTTSSRAHLLRRAGAGAAHPQELVLPTRAKAQLAWFLEECRKFDVDSLNAGGATPLLLSLTGGLVEKERELYDEYEQREMEALWDADKVRTKRTKLVRIDEDRRQ
jgi:hypothetical protein